VVDDSHGDITEVIHEATQATQRAELNREAMAIRIAAAAAHFP